jgi:hypothetical protein
MPQRTIAHSPAQRKPGSLTDRLAPQTFPRLRQSRRDCLASRLRTPLAGHDERADVDCGNDPASELSIPAAKAYGLTAMLGVAAMTKPQTFALLLAGLAAVGAFARLQRRTG